MGTGRPVDPGQEQQQGEPRRPDDEGERPLAGKRIALQGFQPVHAQQHDDEQEEHHDGAGVDNHLHDGEEVGRLLHEQHGDAEQRHHEHQGGVDGVAGSDDPDGAGHDDGGRHGEHRGVGDGDGQDRDVHERHRRH